MTAEAIIRNLAWAVGLFALLVVNALVLVWVERKLIGRFHMRLGPMHNGPQGTLQLVFDAMKMVSKEDTVPASADRIFFRLAPALVALPTYLVYVALPFGPGFGATDLAHGLFFIFAIQALVPIGATVAGWASNNKWSLLGALRSAAMQITYEVPMLLAALGVVASVGSLRLSDIVDAQAGVWFIAKQPLGFALFFVAMLAEANRTPFDMPEAESEIVAGYHTEYSGLKWGLFMMSEYSAMFVGSILVTVLFLGGWSLPFVPAGPAWLGTAVFAAKVYLLIAGLIWIRATLPRVRIDHMMERAWLVLIPVGFLNLLFVGLLVTLFPSF